MKKEQKEEAKADEETVTAEEEQEAPVPFLHHVNNILHSFFSNVEEYINSQQNYNSNGLYAHKSHISNNFLRFLLEYKGFWHRERYNYEDFPDEIMESPLSQA